MTQLVRRPVADFLNANSQRIDDAIRQGGPALKTICDEMDEIIRRDAAAVLGLPANASYTELSQGLRKTESNYEPVSH